MRRPFTRFIVGTFLLVGALAAGISALHYEFSLLDSSVAPPAPDVPLYAYGNLPGSERAVVDAAIAGERFVFAGSDPLPGVGGAFFGGRMVVVRDATYYTFARQLFFDTATVNGLAAIALAVAGVLAIAVALRRDMTRRG